MNYDCLLSTPDSQAQKTLTMEQASKIVTEKASNIVCELMKIRGHQNPPFTPEELATLVGVKRIVKTNLEETGAVLLRLSDGYMIKVNQNHHPLRQTFSCAHEIGHVLLDSLKLNFCIQEVEFRTSPQLSSVTYLRAKERLCDLAATELLMPENVFKTYLSMFGNCINSVEKLAKTFRVSFQTVAIRIAELSTEPCIAILWQQRKKSEALYFAWSVGPGRERGRSFCTPTNKRISFPSTLHDAYHYDSSTECRRDFKLGAVVKRTYMESKGFGRGETRSVISLAFPNR